MNNFNIKSFIPVVAGILIFIALTMGYFTPLLKGKVIEQSDMVLNQGMGKEVNDHRDKYHEEALWTNSMFGGMPAYQISIRYPNNLVKPLRDVFMLWLPTPANIVFTYMLGFFILMLVLKVDRWLAIVGSIAFGFSSFLFLIIAAGHNTQAFAIGYMAPVFAGVILVTRGKYMLGGAITALFMALEVLCNHVQITYYLVLFLVIYVGFDWISKIREKDYKHIVKSLSVFIIAGVLAIGTNITNLWNTYDYAKYTIRGPSELTDNKQNQTSGLDKDYATQWSMGTSETFTLMVPGFKGRSSSMKVEENKSALKDVDPQMKSSIGGSGQYWGDQPFTDSPYSGAIVIFLFVLGLFIVEGRIKWALLTATIFSILLSWGHNFMFLTDLFLDYFPGYNKFRAVSMILMIAEFCIPILAMLAIDKLMKDPEVFKQKIKIPLLKKEMTVQNAFFTAFGLTGGLSLLFYLMPTAFNSFFGSIEYDKIYNQVAESNGKEIADKFMENMEIARIALFKSDAIRSFFFITLAAVALWLFLRKTISRSILIPALGILILLDLAFVDKGYLGDKNFTSKQEAKNPFPLSTADKEILQDTDPDYRVLNMAVSPFNDASTSYYHKSIGGYHAAKLRRYQELIDYHIINEIQNIYGTLKSNPTDSALRATFSQQGVLNMLNTRYIIYNPQAAPLRNRYALGNAWFVNYIKMVKNADEEIKTIGEINPATTAVVDERFNEQVAGFTPKQDAKASIKLVEYKANALKYESETSEEQLALFSEIYYPNGWNAYVDGELKPHFGANWVLRAMRVPAGKHTIEFKFEPTKYYTGEKISLVSCLLLFVFVGAGLFMAWKKKEI